MVIIFETRDRIGRQESLHVADNISAYCKKHGYLFKLHHFEVDPSLGLYGTRWKELLQYWWVADHHQRLPVYYVHHVHVICERPDMH
jgi:hypothetical protein